MSARMTHCLAVIALLGAAGTGAALAQNPPPPVTPGVSPPEKTIPELPDASTTRPAPARRSDERQAPDAGAVTPQGKASPPRGSPAEPDRPSQRRRTRPVPDSPSSVDPDAIGSRNPAAYGTTGPADSGYGRRSERRSPGVGPGVGPGGGDPGSPDDRRKRSSSP